MCSKELNFTSLIIKTNNWHPQNRRVTRFSSAPPWSEKTNCEIIEKNKSVIIFLKPWRSKMCKLLPYSHACSCKMTRCTGPHIPLSSHLPLGWGSPRRVPRWLGARARTIHRISPAGCAASWRRTRWRSRSNEPESTRCRSTSSHPPAGSTAPYLGQVKERITFHRWR